MNVQEYLEGLMLISFSVGWYWSIARMLRTRQSAGKSAGFVVLVCCGYVFGLTSKLLLWQSGGVFSLLVFVYGWNLIVTAFDLFLVYYFDDSRQTPSLVMVRQGG